MSSAGDRVQEEARQIRKRRLEAAGLSEQYSLWQESLPPDTNEFESYRMFMDAQQTEEAAQQGRLSVSTGGTEIDAATDIPTPGPDGEETGPDEAGDTSKGGGEADTDPKLVEGMWEPPKEAETENYEEPSTYKMSRSAEWVKNARVLHKFMNPDEQNMWKTGEYAYKPPELTDEEIGEWARNEMSGFNWNVMNTMQYAQKLTTEDIDPKIAIAFLNLSNMYDHSDGSMMDFAGALGEVATDPTTYVGLGAGSVAAKGASKAMAKTTLKKWLQGAIVGGTAGAVEGGMLAGSFDLTVQNIEQEAGARKDINYGRAGAATGAGAGLGMLLGGAGGAYVGRKADKFAKAIADYKAEVNARDVFLDERSGQELGEKELMEMLGASAKASAATGESDLSTRMAIRILGEDGQVPRLEDGSLDFETMLKHIEDVKVEYAAEQLAARKKMRKETGEPEPDETPIPWNRAEDRQGTGGANDDFVPDISDPESQKLAQKIYEMQELESGDVVLRSEGRPGSRVVDELGDEYEIVGRTKNGWYRMRDNLGREKNLRRKKFEVTDKAPAPRDAGPMELSPFSNTAAKLIEMNERALKEPNRLKEVKTTHAEQIALAKSLEELGIKITDKELYSHWTPSELVFLRDTYDAQAKGMLDLARQFDSRLQNEGRLLDSDLARFNNAHSIFVSTRDLFFGVSGNAARQLNILRSKPTSGVYDFSQSLLDSISLQGGRANTERAIGLMAEFASQRHTRGTKGKVETLTGLSKSIWGNPTAAMLLNVRYNMMLSSWRTHFFNFLGNSASGVYQHLLVSPVKMGINNFQYARELAWSVLTPNSKPDPADRLTRHNYYAELRGHFASARDSWMLAKEILMGRDIGEGKVWNELGLRYNVVNVPETTIGKTLTTPVRALEAGDAFFKNQYYNSKMHEFASIQARADEVHGQKDYQQRYQHYLDNPDELGGAAERAAREFAQKQTYTNDPNIYGGILSVLAETTASAQNKSLAVNMIIPFVRTPANLLSYSMEMIGANTVLSPSKTYDSIMKGSAQESQEALSRLTIAAGLWLGVNEIYQNGDITGTGPSNWEERKVWEAAGWQPNSIKIHGKWYSMDRAAPAGQSLATIASVFDYYAMTQQQDKPAMEWIGAGLLYTADMVLDESYLSTAMDVVTAISSKEEARIRSASSSMITSIFVPNFIRDLRRPYDEQKRSTTSTNLLDQMHKQMMNATPGYFDLGQGSSVDLPPARDWKGEPKNYYGNAYHRALVPFNVKDPSKSDLASMALAYARIPVSQPNKTISWPKGQGDAIDLFAMDGGQGYVYDEYLKIMGANRQRAVDKLMTIGFWEERIANGEIGPGSDGDYALRKALGIGSKFGRLEMLNFLIDHSGDNNVYRRMGPDGKEVPYLIQHAVSTETYIQLREAVRREDLELTDEEKQYIIRKPVEGPEFFKP